MEAGDVRLTRNFVRLAKALIDNYSDGRHWGYELSKKSGVRSGAMYPLLRRLLAYGWLSDGWQEPDSNRKHPPRRYYTITTKGCWELSVVLDTAKLDDRFFHLFAED